MSFLKYYYDIANTTMHAMNRHYNYGTTANHQNLWFLFHSLYHDQRSATLTFFNFKFTQIISLQNIRKFISD